MFHVEHSKRITKKWSSFFMPNHGKKGGGGEESGGDEEKRRERKREKEREKREKLSNNSTENNREIKIECSLHFHVLSRKRPKNKIQLKLIGQ